jgi:hypothetical protein
MHAIAKNRIGDYWAESGIPGQALKYTRFNIPSVMEDVPSLLKDESVFPNKKQVLLNKLKYGLNPPESREEILSLMTAFGLLTFSKGKVSIPNREVRSEFIAAIEEEERFGALHDLVASSCEIVDATLSKDSDALSVLLNRANADASPFLSCDNESELTNIICMAYLTADDRYDLKRLNPDGKGFADVLFTPIDKDKPAFVVELMVDEMAEAVLEQLKARNCIKELRPKGVSSPALLVAIAYDRKTKVHSCEIEELIFLSEHTH